MNPLLCVLCKIEHDKGLCNGNSGVIVDNLDKVYCVGLADENKLVERLIHKYKYQSGKGLSVWIAKEVEEFAIENGLKDLTFVPVSSHEKRIKQRGFDNNFEVAKRFKKLKWVCALKRKRFLQTQVGLDREERMRNVENAFSGVKLKELEGVKVVVFDDIGTTFATLNAAAGVLKKSGFDEVFGLVLLRK